MTGRLGTSRSPGAGDWSRPHEPQRRSAPGRAAEGDQREYNSTISDSLISEPNSSRSGVFLKMPSIFEEST